MTRWSAVVSIGSCSLLTVLAASLPAIGLPSIARELQISDGASIGLVLASQTALAAVLLPLAAVGDWIGHRRLCALGLCGVAIGSVASALSPSFAWLLGARIVQSLGCAAIFAVTSALIRDSYPPNLLGRGLANNSMIVAVSMAISPPIAGLLLSVASWRALFVLPAVFALITLLFGIRHLPQSQSGTHRPDVQGATLIALSFGPLVAGISLLSLRYSLPTALLLTATGLVIGIVLLRHQRARPVPMLPLDLLRNPATGLAVATSFTSHAAQQVAQIALPFILLNSLHYSAKVTGMLLAIWPAAMLATTPLSGHLADRLSAARMGVAGLTMAAFGFAALAYADADNFWWMGTALALVGAGVSVFQTPNNRLIVASAPLHRRGMVGGVLSTTRITGHSLGAAGAAYLVQFPAHPMLPLATACALAIAAATLSAIRPR